MKKVIHDDNVFNVEQEKTAAFYREQPVIFGGLSSYLSESTALLIVLGFYGG